MSTLQDAIEGKQTRPNLSNERLAELAREQGELEGDVELYGDDGVSGGLGQTTANPLAGDNGLDADGGVHIEVTGEELPTTPTPGEQAPPAAPGADGLYDGVPLGDGVPKPEEVAGYYKTPIMGRDATTGQPVIVGWNAKYQTPEAMEAGTREAQQAMTAAQAAQRQAEQTLQELLDAGVQPSQEQFAAADDGSGGYLPQQLPQSNPMFDVAGEAQTIATLEALARTNPQEAALAALRINRGDLYDRYVDGWAEFDDEGAKAFDRQVQQSLVTAQVDQRFQQFEQQQAQQLQQQQAQFQTMQQQRDAAAGVLQEAQSLFLEKNGVTSVADLNPLAESRMNELWAQRTELHQAAGSPALLAAAWHSLYLEAAQEVGSITAAGGNQRLQAHQAQQLAGAHTTMHSAPPAQLQGDQGAAPVDGVRTHSGIETPESVLAGIRKASQRGTPWWKNNGSPAA